MLVWCIYDDDQLLLVRLMGFKLSRNAKACGLIKTLTGRVRHIPDICAGADAARVSAGERQAVNSIIQGSASDIIKLAMVILDQIVAERWPQHWPLPRLLMQIHDELVFEVCCDSSAGSSTGADADPESSNRISLFEELLREAMVHKVAHAMNLKVPLEVNIHSGINWAALKK